MAVVSFDITSRAPYADGQSFGETGPYEAITASVTFAVDPEHPANEGIVDLKLAPRDAEGRVRFRSDFYLVLPVEPARGNRRVLIDLPNRGRKLYGNFNRATRLEGPAAPSDDPGDGFLFRRGWSAASIGWQWDVIPDGKLLAFDAPPVIVDGKPVTGQNAVTIRPNGRQRCFLLANRSHLTYPAVHLDDPAAKLYVRDHENGADTLIPREAWRFAREEADGSIASSADYVYMEAGFEGGKTYNLVYEAAGAKVVGAGLLAFREIASFLRYGSPLSPLPAFKETYGFGISQTGRLQRHFLYLGLNQDEDGRQAFDGMLLHVAGGRRGEFNHRFAQPSVSMTPGFGNRFPFADDDSVDPYSGREDGMLRRLRARGCVPKLIYTNTSAEYWRGDAGLLHVDATGSRDLPPAPESRIYHFTGTQHTAGALPQRDLSPNDGSRGRHGFNLVDYTPLLRAALINLESWVADGTEPPASAHSRLQDGTLTRPETVFQAIGRLPGAYRPKVEGLPVMAETDLGPDADRGIGVYPAKIGRLYPRLVPALDADGNERAGVRLPDISVPVATHTGWNPRHPDTGAPDLIIAMMGTTRFFPATAADRERTGDPRLSIEERYGGMDHYLALVRQASERLAEQRYILPEDVDLVVRSAGERYEAAMSGSERSGVK